MSVKGCVLNQPTRYPLSLATWQVGCCDAPHVALATTCYTLSRRPTLRLTLCIYRIPSALSALLIFACCIALYIYAQCSNMSKISGDVLRDSIASVLEGAKTKPRKFAGMLWHAHKRLPFACHPHR